MHWVLRCCARQKLPRSVQFLHCLDSRSFCEKGVNFSSIPSTTATPHNGKSNIIFLFPGYVHWFTCTNDSRLTHGNLGPQIWLYAGEEPSNEGARSSYLSQTIVQGPAVWIGYFHSSEGKKPRTEKRYYRHSTGAERMYVIHSRFGRMGVTQGETRGMRLRVDSRKGVDGKSSLANFKVFF